MTSLLSVPKLMIDEWRDLHITAAHLLLPINAGSFW